MLNAAPIEVHRNHMMAELGDRGCRLPAPATEIKDTAWGLWAHCVNPHRLLPVLWANLPLTDTGPSILLLVEISNPLQGAITSVVCDVGQPGIGRSRPVVSSHLAGRFAIPLTLSSWITYVLYNGAANAVPFFCLLRAMDRSL